jgi:hypothetical protein
MYHYKLTLCKRHSENPDRSVFDLDHFYSIDFASTGELVDNMLRNEAHLLQHDMCALITRHYNEKERMLVILEKGYGAGYGIFYLNNEGFHKVKNKYRDGRVIGIGINPASQVKYSKFRRLQITFFDCTVWYVDARNASDARKEDLERELLQIESECGVPKFNGGEIIHSCRMYDSWINHITHVFTERSKEPLYAAESNAHDAFLSKEVQEEQKVALFPEADDWF